ncbi:sugar transferase [Mycobacterium sp. TNTM28]|uniref:Sugar transferase n=1 Tax=[Mycobacterium] fortunisiensis TaxID=2600579 RepID=A0ABS6KGP5_9MYCO|nr:sugar transferase [[Mycobacterium] fortunisiensis]
MVITLSSIVGFLLVHRWWPGVLTLGDRHMMLLVLVAVTWFAALSVRNLTAENVLRTYVHELQLAVGVTVPLFGVVVVAYILGHFIPHMHGVLYFDGIDLRHLAVALPLGLVGTMAVRYVLSRRIAEAGGGRTPVLLAGGQEAVQAMANAIRCYRRDRFEIVGACTTEPADKLGESIGTGDHSVPVIGDDRSIVEAARKTGAQLVAAATTDRLGYDELLDLATDLEDAGVDLAVATDVPGAAEPAARMPMLQILAPGYRRARSMSKRLFDIVFSLAAVLATGPVMVTIAVAIKLTSPGPVFYISERIGRNGVPFRMVKFRSMRDGADRDVAEMIASTDDGPVFFKVKADPRVTPVGSVIRKYSLDELPQFFNVLAGSMSMVGPRPQVQREVDSYDETMRRRLLVKPGVTGQWQVSGRSNLSAAESIRHDVSYVNNCSMGLDLSIIAKTIGAVVRGEGAY